jgi:hypothetical protein
MGQRASAPPRLGALFSEREATARQVTEGVRTAAEGLLVAIDAYGREVQESVGIAGHLQSLRGDVRGADFGSL